MASIISASTTSGTALNMSADTTGVLQLATGATPTTAVTIDTSQNVGIGTTIPSSKLSILGAEYTGDPANPIQIQIGSTTAYNANPSGGWGAYLKYNSSGAQAGMGGIYVAKANTTDGDYGSFMSFSTRPNGSNVTERMRIDSSGNLQVGTTSGGSERLYVTQSVNSSTAYFLNNNGTTATQYGIVVKLNGDPNNTNHMVQCIGNTTTRAEIRANGGIANYSANNVNLSDQREKTNVELASSYLDKICAIPVKTFNYIDQNMEEDGGLTLGVIAQDVQAVAPELVTESNWGTEEEPKERLSIYQTDLQYALMKCIQEQQTIINDLKARIETLEAK